MTREAMKRTLGMRHFDVQLDRRHRPPPGPDRRDEDRRGQDPRRPARGGPQRADRTRRPRRHRQRLPRPARPAVDGPGLPLPRHERRDDQPRRVATSSSPATRRATSAWSTSAPSTAREAYAADITYGTNNEFGFDYLRDNMVGELDQRVQRGQLRDRRRGRQHPHRRGPHAADHQRPGRGVGRPVLHLRPARAPRSRADPRARRGRRLLHRPQGQGRHPDRGRHRQDGEARSASPTSTAPTRRWPVTSSRRCGPRAVQARPRLHRQGRRDHHRRRVHRPPDARPPLERGPPPGSRSQGGPARPARVGDPGDDHLPELLPPLRQAGRHDRYGDDRGRGVRQDLQARGRRDPDPPADDPRRRRGPGLPQRDGQVQRRRRRDRRDAGGRPAGPRRHDLDREVRGPLGDAQAAGDQARGPQRQVPREGGRRSSPRPGAPAPSRSPRTWPAAAPTSCSAATRPASPARSSIGAA